MSAAPTRPDEASAQAPTPSIGGRRLGRFMMQVLWPAFMMAIVAEGLFFSMVDPQELVIVGLHLADSREAAYTVGFFLFWLLFACSSGITYLLSHGMEELPPPRGNGS